MGMFGSLIGGADEAASAADDAASSADDVADEVVSFADDSYLERLGADVLGRAAEQPARATDAATSNFSTAGKWLGGGATASTGLWAGSSVYEDYADNRQTESKENTYEEYVEQVESIRNNPNLSPEEKQDMLDQVEEAYRAAIQNAEDQPDPKGALSEAYNNIFGGMGMVDKVVVAIIIIVAIKTAREAL